jgi:hypothetical protein
MSNDPTEVRGERGSNTRGVPASQYMSAKPRGRALIIIVVLVLTVGLASVWTFVAQQQLAKAIAQETGSLIDIARRSFDTLRAQTHAALQAHCRVLVEDPRLKSTLAIEGMDEPTVADILKDLGELRGGGFLLVLSADGRVFAQTGAPELRGLDLSSSSILKKASETKETIVGSWVLAGKVMDLSVRTIRYGEQIIAFLAVGQPVDDQLLRAVEEQTGVAVASTLASTVVHTSSKDIGPLFARVATEPASAVPQAIAWNGTTYLAATVDLPETAQSHRLVLVAAVDKVAARFTLVKWMIFAPPLLVLIAVLFSLTGARSTRRN